MKGERIKKKKKIKPTSFDLLLKKLKRKHKIVDTE